MQAQPREVIVTGEKHVRVGFVVPQQNIVRRTVSLDQALFQQQRFGFITRDRGIDLLNAGDQRFGLWAEPGLAKIAGQALFQIAGLADIQKFAVGIEHAIHAGLAAGRGQKGLGIEYG